MMPSHQSRRPALIHEPLLHARQQGLDAALLLGNLAPPGALQTSFRQQAHHSGKPRIVHDIGKTALVVGHGHTHRFQKYVFRSEEHTSELQSLMRISYAVFCLKKKTKKYNNKKLN